MRRTILNCVGSTAFAAVIAATYPALTSAAAEFPASIAPAITYTPESREQLVRKFIEAFNAKDVDGMAAMVTTDVQWLSIAGKAISTDAESREALVKSMTAYFKSCPSCRSQIGRVVATGERLSAVEVARWESKSGAKEQQSISVYEFAGPLIKRVYYFPAER